jgi:hypothetical protein
MAVKLLPPALLHTSSGLRPPSPKMEKDSGNESNVEGCPIAKVITKIIWGV